METKQIKYAETNDIDCVSLGIVSSKWLGNDEFHTAPPEGYDERDEYITPVGKFAIWSIRGLKGKKEVSLLRDNGDYWNGKFSHEDEAFNTMKGIVEQG
jgi:hypothetical protein